MRNLVLYLILGRRSKETRSFSYHSGLFFSPYRCGFGLSGEVLTDLGHQWVGYDISRAMLGSFETMKANRLLIRRISC